MTEHISHMLAKFHALHSIFLLPDSDWYPVHFRTDVCTAFMTVAPLKRRARRDEWADNGIRSIKVIGDAEAPGPIAWQLTPAAALPASWMKPTVAMHCPSAARSRPWPQNRLKEPME